MCDAHGDECCARGSDEKSGGALGMFEQFLGEVTNPGAIDVVAKRLMAVSLSLAVNCVPCSRDHIRKALGMGIGEVELEEAAALAASFAGCKALMLWKQMKEELLSK